MSEKKLWKNAKKCLLGDVMRVENSILTGVPDVNGCYKGFEYWIELKCVSTWPKRARTVVKIKHYTNLQREWISRRGKNGGNVFLLLQVSNTYLLFDYRMAMAVGYLTRSELITNCMAHGVELKKVTHHLQFSKKLLR